MIGASWENPKLIWNYKLKDFTLGPFAWAVLQKMKTDIPQF